MASLNLSKQRPGELLLFIQPVDYLLVAWFLLAALSTAYVAWDQFRNNPEPAVMKWGFILVTLYLGPVGLLLYVLADKEPRPNTHEEFVKPLWKQGIGSTIHCVAGDATGIIIAAVITAVAGLPMWLDIVVEYVAGFAVGLFVFQALFMKNMMGGSYWQNVRNSFMPEFISMNAMMAGMAPVMAILMMGRDMRAMWPGEMLFWGVMAFGIGVGFATAYPFNVWLVSKELKHGLMTARSGDQKGTVAGGQESSKNSAHESEARHAQHASRHASASHGSHQHGTKLPPALAPTRTQLATMVAFTLIMLAGGYAFPFTLVNMGLSAHDVGRSIMAPGMIMTFDTPADAMKDMAAVDPRDVSFEAPADAHGASVLEPQIEGGVKVFDLAASVIRWTILPGVTVEAYAYNNQVPGPTLRVTEGDRIRINVRNELPESTTVHWHGLILPNEMDGPAMITQKPIEPGQSYSYEYTVGQRGTYFYHTHDHVDRQQALGLYGALIIDPKDPADAIPADAEYVVQLQEWIKRDWLTFPSMPMEGALPNYFTINGKSFPATETVRMKVGQTLKVRFIGSNTAAIHPMHIHGGPFEVVAVDGETLAQTARYLADTVNIAPGQRYDVLWRARKPGKWLIHCHISHHTTNNNVETDGGGGLMVVIDVAGGQTG
ncbi:multicopper oxidase domain-containing protein [Rhizobium leguminosarum]|uniref:multicopper oxidase domain-containing protein n=1 Tax=Rhizobium leguminosarum TaxID=384 RepID=UPI00067F63F6